jgi:hypothetical protein
MMPISKLPPLPIKEKKRGIQVDIGERLFLAIEREKKMSKRTLTAIVEWGLRAYLLKSNPKLAEQIGIVGEE